MLKDEIYIKLEGKYITEPKSDVYLTDVAEVYCKNPNIQKYLEGIKVYKAKEEEISDFVSAIDIISKIENEKDNINVNLLGKPEVLIEIKGGKEKSSLFKYLKVFIICATLFLGAGLAIINFNVDVNMKQSMENIYYIITGNKKDTPLILLIPYSIGIGLGMTAFFSSAFSNKSRRSEPGPMEVEMDLFSKDVDDFIVEKIKNSNKPL